MNRSAFTLIELMIATAITCLVAAGTFMFFSGSGRISRAGYREINNALSNRVDREKRLFVPARTDGTVFLPCDGLAGEVDE